MITRFLETTDISKKRIVCSFQAHELAQLVKQELLPVDACMIYSIEWIINSSASFEISSEGQHLLFISGNGRVEDFCTAISSLQIEPVLDVQEGDTISVIVTFGKKY